MGGVEEPMSMKVKEVSFEGRKPGIASMKKCFPSRRPGMTTPLLRVILVLAPVVTSALDWSDAAAEVLKRRIGPPGCLAMSGTYNTFCRVAATTEPEVVWSRMQTVPEP